ncbi:MAG: sigma-70 family RNA polymerase sigma factor [Anaerolineae bacterium]|nr:sigma-70 family RNA polymerase sigma factor [Anaerolineae bacterium]
MTTSELDALLQGDDLVRIYMRDIGRVALLTPEEEIHYGRRVQAAVAARARLETVASPEEEAAILALLRDGELARQHLVMANLRLVVSIAKKYVGRGLTLQDLIQEGTLGLMRATETFDPERGFRFATFAHWWIKQAVSRAIADQGRLIRLPAHQVEALNALRRARVRLMGELGRDPTTEEMALAMPTLTDDDRAVILGGRQRNERLPIALNRKLRAAVREVETLLILEQEIQPLDPPSPDGEESDPDSHHADPNALEPAEEVTQKLLKDEIAILLEALEPRERSVLERRFGLLDGDEETLEQVGQALRLTRERVRQIEVKALRKLRRLVMLYRLYEYV